MCCLNFYRVQFLVLLPLYLVDVVSELLFTCFVLDFAMERKLKQWWSTISVISTIQTITVCLYSYCFVCIQIGFLAWKSLRKLDTLHVNKDKSNSRLLQCNCVKNVFFSEVHGTRSLFFVQCFVDRCLSFYPFFFWPLCCLFFFNLQILITPLVSSNFS
jgi:hypothetical protein